jgi:hypothetical protein
MAQTLAATVALLQRCLVLQQLPLEVEQLQPALLWTALGSSGLTLGPSCTHCSLLLQQHNANRFCSGVGQMLGCCDRLKGLGKIAVL